MEEVSRDIYILIQKRENMKCKKKHVTWSVKQNVFISQTIYIIITIIYINIYVSKLLILI